jgi:hypothetical protein
MRITLIVLLVAAALFVLLQAFTAVSTARTEQQRYSVVVRDGAFEVRHYPAALLVSVQAPDTGYRAAANPSFRRLAGYIFGGNEDSLSIAMTAPVHMERGAEGSRMSFVLPAAMTMDSLPAPNDPGVSFGQFPESHMAALRFGGFSDDAILRVKEAELLAACRQRGLEVTGPVRSLGYDPPWQLVGRRNEVAVPVRWPR